MGLPHYNTNNRKKLGPENGKIFKTDDPKRFVRVYTMIEEIDLNRLESDLAEYQETKELYDLLAGE